jgi:hypothetical protein
MDFTRRRWPRVRPLHVRPRCEGTLGLCRRDSAVATHLTRGGAFHSFPCLEAGEVGIQGLLVPLVVTLTLLPA